MQKSEDFKKNLELKETLDNLVFGTEDTIPVDNGQEIADVRNQVKLYTDFNELSANSKKESKKIVESIVKFYLDLDLINKSDYVKYKKSIDERTLSSTMFQLETAEYACIKLLEEIDSGNANLKVFEILGKLQETTMKIAEVQAATVNRMEESYKKMRNDNEHLKMLNGEEDKNQNDDDLRIKGSRTLIELAQKISKDAGIDKMEVVEIKVDPRQSYREEKQNEGREDNPDAIDEDLFG